MLSTATLRRSWAPACNVPLQRVDIVQGVQVRCHARAATAVRALGRVLEAHAYAVRQRDTSAYACRAITGGSGPSLHAFGIAIDVNWNTNPYRADNVLVTDMPRAMVEDILRIRTKNGEQVWRWGGEFTSIKDSMHYEIACAPADLATGIDWNTVRQPRIRRLAPHRWPLIQRGDGGPAVRKLQRILRVVAPGDSGYGVFGPRTEAAVRSYQRRHGLNVDGKVGRQTWTALLTAQPEATARAPGPVKKSRKRQVPRRPNEGRRARNPRPSEDRRARNP